MLASTVGALNVTITSAHQYALQNEVAQYFKQMNHTQMITYK